MYKNVFVIHAYPFVAALATIFGMACYFLLPIEPSVSIGIVLSIVSCALLMIFRHQHIYSVVATGLLFGGLSFGYATFYSQHLQTVFISQDYAGKQLWVRGKVVDIWQTEKRSSFTLAHVKVYGLAQEQAPQQIKISVDNKRAEEFQVGHWLSAQVILQRPYAPQFRGDYNQQRADYFDGIGARGYVMGSIYSTWVEPKDRYDTVSEDIQRLRSHISDTILQDDTQQEALVSALLTGIKGRISPEVYDSFRNSGLAHLLAISGLHLALFGGFIFVLLRRLLCLWPTLVLKYSSKKMAAVGALMATFGYMLLAGGTIPTVRAFIMIGLLFIAILFGRVRISFRVLCVAAIVILFLYPESVLSVSFQMSFIAVFALILWNEYRERETKSHLKLVSFLDYITATVLTALIAGLATMPIAGWHFGEISVGGFLANIIAVPLTALWIMPCGLLVLLLMPFGWHQPIQALMEVGTGLLMDIADYVSGLPFSHFAIDVQMMGILWVAVVTVLLLLFLPKYWKQTGVCAAVVLVAVTSFLTKSPQVTWLSGGEVVLLNTPTGVQPLYAGEEHKYVLERYVNKHNLPLAQVQPEGCDSIGCVFELAEGEILALKDGMLPTVEDCHKNVLILPLEMNRYCMRGKADEEPFLYAEGWIKNNRLYRKVQRLHSRRVWQVNL